MNTAISLAIKGEKVLAIDGDLRHASLSQFVNSPKHGLADYLAKKANNIDELLVKYEAHNNLHILPAGTIPPNPTELLYDERFGALMEEMQKRYDYIILDCPPVEIVADTQIIEKYVDRTIFVVRAGLLDKSMLPELERLYKENKHKNMSYILNATEDFQSGRYGYHYGYHNQPEKK